MDLSNSIKCGFKYKYFITLFCYSSPRLSCQTVDSDIGRFQGNQCVKFLLGSPTASQCCHSEDRAGLKLPLAVFLETNEYRACFSH